jgi:Tol biopolymer transport system component
VAFESKATNLVKGDTNKTTDIFLRDLKKGTTRRISVSAKGKQANGESSDASISNHGGFVAYDSRATNLVPGEVGTEHVFLFSLRGKPKTQQVDVSNAGASGNRTAALPGVSADGKLVVFESLASNLVAGTTRHQDIYVRGPLH